MIAPAFTTIAYAITPQALHIGAIALKLLTHREIASLKLSLGKGNLPLSPHHEARLINASAFEKVS
jgi:hypothetical protein